LTFQFIDPTLANFKSYNNSTTIQATSNASTQNANKKQVIDLFPAKRNNQLVQDLANSPSSRVQNEYQNSLSSIWVSVRFLFIYCFDLNTLCLKGLDNKIKEQLKEMEKRLSAEVNLRITISLHLAKLLIRYDELIYD
jgi:hypothetical protein